MDVIKRKRRSRKLTKHRMASDDPLPISTQVNSWAVLVMLTLCAITVLVSDKKIKIRFFKKHNIDPYQYA
jgi:hypothetical protein